MTQIYYVVVNAQGQFLKSNDTWSHCDAFLYEQLEVARIDADTYMAKVHTVTMTFGPELT